MPVRFSRLRIAGFKSFAEPAVVEILPGLTGIVGPNGCGKSNVVEALRWAMGENSARTLRGGEMDDVIFAGTANRASRNIAEVSLLLDETQGAVPPPHHEAPELEVSRRIERGSGSLFRVNGREVRARDVQTLFADLASGARSSAMVSQGRVGAIVNARPDERRMVLEEAAGITGLHARRHEAELKLRAAEANLARAQDLHDQLSDQIQGLQRQARQANRYRNISGAIRTAEAELLAIQRARVEQARDAARQTLHAANTAVADATSAATAATSRATDATAGLPPLREAEGLARTTLERHRVAREQTAAEEAQARDALGASAQRLQQLGHDLAHAEQLARDAAAAVARLADENARLQAEDAEHPPNMQRAEAAAEIARHAARSAEARADAATEHAADLAARHRALTDALAAAEQRTHRLSEQATALQGERAQVAAKQVDPERLAAAFAEREAAEQALEQARIALDTAEQARNAVLAEAKQSRAAAQEAADRSRAAAQAAAAQTRAAAHEGAVSRRAAAQHHAEALRSSARGALTAARERAAIAEGERAKLAAEARALAEILAVEDNERWPRMVDQLVVPAGLEAALGAALGEELESAADQNAARHWRDLSPLDPIPALPADSRPLAELVSAPAALGRALSQIGLIDEGAGTDTQKMLAPGQVLVSRAGGVWRWDGYVIQAGTPTPAAVRLQQRNRLSAVRGMLEQAARQAVEARAGLNEAETAEHRARAEADRAEQATRAEAESAETTALAAAAAAEHAARADAEAQERAAREAADTAEGTASEVEQEARDARRDAEQRLEHARADAAVLAEQAASAAARAAALDEQASRLAVEVGDVDAALRRAREALVAIPDPDEGRAAMERARAELSAARSHETAALAERDALAQAATIRAQRSRAIAAERADWTQRSEDARGRHADLAAREDAARIEHAGFEAAPARIAARHAEALDALDAAEAAHRRAAEALAEAEASALAADRAARAAEAALAAAREQVVRAESEAIQADHAWGLIAERILERLGTAPSLPDPPADIGPEAEEKARRRTERLQREREEMGPVNLRAEVEAEEINQRIDALAAESAELSAAIAKLRGSIGHLNREGRERLAVMFEQIDRHFQALFSRMFGGGRAHLALVGSDDPLQAGLEIYAQPPGKKLATLSLLSGGEQALTALSLIFAVFRCNPAPVCVLDEVDAPLDDANVERFCKLLEDMVRETDTRFLVVTHHHLTMARMDRLYGVTMQERGVSRLLSVDLHRAAEMVDTPRLAAAE